MADLSVKSTRKKKRKLASPGENKHGLLKSHRIDNSEKAKEVEGAKSSKNEELGRPWRNLHLILSLQNKDTDLQRKVEIAFDYVNSRAKEGGDGIDEDYQTVKVFRLIVFLNDWVQSLLISTDKRLKVDEEKYGTGVIEACLDYRCWMIFKFCLEESLRLQVSLSFSKNLLRAICCIARNALSLLLDVCLDSDGSFFGGEEFELYGITLDCVSLVFSSHGGLSNENLDLWISTVCIVLELVLKVYDKKCESSKAGAFAVKLCCLLLEPFAGFLKVHPARKNGFRDFVDKLLEPLLHLMGILHCCFDGDSPGSTTNLLDMVKGVLQQGLFHPIHIDGFLDLRSTDKYSGSNDGKLKDSKTVVRSYHRHLFDKLETIMAQKKESVLNGLGELFQLLVDRVKMLKGSSLLTEETKMLGKTGGSGRLFVHTSEKSYPSTHNGAVNLNAEKRKAVFNFLMQIMEPLTNEMNGYLQTKLEVHPSLLDVHCLLKSINNLLAGIKHDKLYIKTEDISGGAFFNFLKAVYVVIFSFGSTLLYAPTAYMDIHTREILTLLGRELFVAVGHFLDVDYEVLENDLSRLWLMIISYLAIGHSSKDAPDQCPLTSQILGLGCQLVKLYSELRQVKNVIFALCKAIRLIIVSDNSGHVKLNCGSSVSCASLPHEAYVKSVEILLCSQEFKLAICNGVKSIPEGQASECIRQLSTDISESIEWIKVCGSAANEKEVGKSNARSYGMCCFDLQAELYGRGLPQIYTLVLDSLSVTVGNCIFLGRSIKDLMTVIRPSMSILVGLQPDSVNEFLSSITGNDSDGNILKLGVCSCWILMFFFRLYVSCRSLYRQAISQMPPDISKKMSAVMGDSVIAYSGRECMERTDWTNEGYFSWIIQPSASLLVIIQSISDVYLQGDIADCCPLVYVLNVMALQRLVDLNKQIRSLEYMQQHDEVIVQNKLLDDAAALSKFCKRSRKWGRRISAMNQEAAGLTAFITSYLSLLRNDKFSVHSSNHATCLDTFDQALNPSDKWDLGVCTVNQKSLPTAFWWILCQNIDIWFIHASKKKLKLFLTHVIRTSLPSTTRRLTEIGEHNMNKGGLLNQITVHQISSKLISDSVLYEHKFACRHLASRFCHLLEESVLLLFCNFSTGDINLSSSPNWQEVLCGLKSVPMVVLGNKPSYDKNLRPQLSSDIAASISRGSTSMKFSTCQNLLSLLCWMPKGHMNSSSFSLHATHVLNLERLIIGTLLEQTDVLSSHIQYELLRLLVSCRRALKYIVTSYCDKKMGTMQYSCIPFLSEGPFSILWLLKSVSIVVGLQEMLSQDCTNEVRDMIFSFMDQTSYVFLALGKYQCICALHSVIAERPQSDSTISDAKDQSGLNESYPCPDSSKDFEAWKSVILVSEILKDEAQSLFLSLKDTLCNGKVGDTVNVGNLNKMSSTLSCLSGFLWGLASALTHMNESDGDYKGQQLKLRGETLSRFNICINTFAEFIGFCLNIFFTEDDHQSGNLYDSQNVLKGADGSGLGEFTCEGSAWTTMLSSEQHKESEVATLYSVSAEIVDDTCMPRHSAQSEGANSVASVLTKFNSFESQSLNKHLLQRLLQGDHPEASNLIRQLLVASSSILRLSLWTKCNSLANLVPSFINVSQFLLLMVADVTEMPQPFTFVWLDGALKYLQELGSHFSSPDPILTRTLYDKLIELVLKALGKCISLQGKGAALASHERESSTKIIPGYTGSSEPFVSQRPYYLDEFKASLRVSFKMLIEKPSELHIFSAIQAIERALIGVREGCTIIYELNTGGAGGGKISSTVVAGIDCLDLVLEYVSGRKRLNVVKRHIQSLVAALFNIILHLQSPLIFYDMTTGSKRNDNPDPGAAILMCVEVLTRVSGKHALFELDSWQVAQSLHIPAALFQDFGQLTLSESPISSSSLPFSDNQVSDPLVGTKTYSVDRQFSIELYAACCRLLYTVLKHYKSESDRCIALIQDSARVLLHCLEIVDIELVVRKDYFSWDVQEAVKCACFFRRIYEELRQQKDVFGRHCFKFLSNYICVYSGLGPLKAGIRREIDEALRPGVYALIDACSADDLQYLHTTFGEGPCRNTLSTLQHDYKLNFQYEGKV